MYEVKTPGKLIISGEHAVVYGSPALAAAIDRYVQVQLTFLHESVVEFAFADEAPLVRFTFSQFWQRVEQLTQCYQQYLRQQCAINEVVTHLYDLPVYALGLIAQLAKKDFTQGIRITVTSNLPMGCGLGSSAAAIVSLLQIGTELFNCPCNRAELLQLAIQAESLQHGQSSGLDPSICLHGGVVLYSAQKITARTRRPWSAYLINTGKPQSSTGECVAWVSQHTAIRDLLPAFKAVTVACDAALQVDSGLALQQAIRENHRLLCQIGVVPKRVQTCIEELEKQHFAAKICGAGSIRGDNAGYLLVLGNNKTILENIAQQFNFTLEQVQLGVNI